MNKQKGVISFDAMVAIGLIALLSMPFMHYVFEESRMRIKASVLENHVDQLHTALKINLANYEMEVSQPEKLICIKDTTGLTVSVDALKSYGYLKWGTSDQSYSTGYLRGRYVTSKITSKPFFGVGSNVYFPTAIEISAELHGFDADKMRQYVKGYDKVVSSSNKKTFYWRFPIEDIGKKYDYNKISKRFCYED
ncbi:hypothetical protein SL034_004286 [Vibrio harveyi]|uniref:hypothetical protein n=1 Tax=Vibrio harveyi group TaxID=717610 RepID=UPI000971B859|nr:MULTISPECIES: hypothetical protein [Vibrio harveyi group]APX10104.1 hypothetical protein BWP24_28355 [Vibrio campbellii]ELY1989198.1 hypothetical protein [Vibrio harveyi]WCP78869.1 hypothetical protein PPW95_25545 [Vibrio parahaemolyticus]WHP52936.1 hypothetical protein QMY43_25300 [Vibrio parahaemolyticus]